MEMCYGGVLVMPQNYTVMGEEEMIYVAGGSCNVPMSKNLDSKSGCGGVAQRLFASQEVKRMTIHEMAVELYAHAVCYYHYDKVALLVGTPMAYYCYSNAKDGVALMDGGDSAVRKAFYNTVWNLF